MRKYVFLVSLVICLLAGCRINEEVGANEEKEIATADWVEKQEATLHGKISDIEERLKQMESEMSRLKQAASAPPFFHDVKLDHWAYVEIMNLYKNGVIRGYEDVKMFYPERQITRYQAASMLVKALNLPLSSSSSTFSDVPKNSPIAREIMTVFEAGLFTGDKGKFFPNEPMKRKHMAIVLQRAFTLQEKANVPYAGYKDVNSQTSGADAIRIITQNGIAKGSNGYFYPEHPTTRAQFATFIYRALQQK